MQINLKERLQSLRMVAGLAEFLKNPGSLDSVFAVARSLQHSPLSTQMFRHLLAEPAMAELVRDNWRPAPINLDALEQLPPSSLGHVYAHQLRSQGLSPESLIDPTPITSPQQYVVHRLRETHDIVHVLTGFGTDGAGELGLQAFNLAQNRSALAVMLIFGGMLKTLQDDEPLEPLLSALARGFELGLRSPCVIARRLEDGWERPLADWQRELGLPLTPGSI
jgi:ubiquinone biosynthesis protein COQ4